MQYQFPTTVLDRPADFLEAMGTHWSQVYAGQDFVLSYLRGLLLLAEQNNQTALEIENSLSRETTPVLQRELAYSLILQESDLNNNDLRALRYGDGAVYGAQPTDSYIYQYGVSRFNTEYWFTLPAGLVDLPVLVNKLIGSQEYLIQHLDYRIDLDRQALIFYKNPFDSVYAQIRDNFVNDSSNRELGLWGLNAGFDKSYMYNRWGYILGVRDKSSDNYKKLINALFQGIICGTSKSTIVETISAVCGIPLAKTTGETVTTITQFGQDQLIITTDNVYRLNTNTTPTVAVGDVLTASDTLCDAFTVYEFCRGELPDDLQGLSLGRSFLSSGYYDGLMFEDKLVDLVVEENVDGYTKVSFALSGADEDVQRFFNELHSKGVEQGETLANLLDVRDNPVNQPTAASLPTTINPLEFLITNVLRNNAFLVRLHSAKIGDNPLSLGHLRHLQKVIPPHTAIIILAELTAPVETVVLDGTDPNLDYVESADLLRVFEQTTENVNLVTLVSENTSLHYVSEICQ